MSFRILSGPDRVVLGGNLVMQPFVRYVLPAGPAQTFALAMQRRGLEYTHSVFNSNYRPYGGADLNGKRVAFYRHSAFGDQLMATSVAAYLKHLYPTVQIDVYCTPDVMEIWRGLGVRVFPAPMTLEAVRAYDWHLFYDQMLEENSEDDQACAYDDLFGFAGLRDVADVFKRPKVANEIGDVIELSQLNAEEVLFEKFLVYQLGAANSNRTYPPEQGGEFLRQFLERFPDWNVVLVGLDKTGADSAALWGTLGVKRKTERVLDLINDLRNFRSLIPLVAAAGLVVCPDSSIGHLAAAFPSVPVISLWGLFAPDDRAKYYPNHHPLWPREVCPYAPCRNHEFTLPVKLCSQATNATEGTNGKWCHVLRAVTPELILAKAEQILNP